MSAMTIAKMVSAPTCGRTARATFAWVAALVWNSIAPWCGSACTASLERGEVGGAVAQSDRRLRRTRVGLRVAAARTPASTNDLRLLEALVEHDLLGRLPDRRRPGAARGCPNSPRFTASPQIVERRPARALAPRCRAGEDDRVRTCRRLDAVALSANSRVHEHLVRCVADRGSRPSQHVRPARASRPTLAGAAETQRAVEVGAGCAPAAARRMTPVFATAAWLTIGSLAHRLGSRPLSLP